MLKVDIIYLCAPSLSDSGEGHVEPQQHLGVLGGRAGQGGEVRRRRRGLGRKQESSSGESGE